jgi:hypothetical protein
MRLCRFAVGPLDYESQKKALKDLVRAYLNTFSSLGIETWLMHGTLLGWWWNKAVSLLCLLTLSVIVLTAKTLQILPWDSDIDVQISEGSIYYLAAYYNMSIFYHKAGPMMQGREYLLEVNPHYKIREPTDKLNVIDARWIDTETGLFIDITAARYNLSHPQGEGILGSKDGHEYRVFAPIDETYTRISEIFIRTNCCH